MGPADTTGLERLIEAGELDPAEVVCVICKTEGNGGRNDFTRGLAQRALEDLLAAGLRLDRSALADRVVLSLSGGCEAEHHGPLGGGTLAVIASSPEPHSGGQRPTP